MSKKNVPDRDAPMIDAQGRITPAWMEFFKDLDARTYREKVSLTSATTLNNNFPARYVSATGLWTPSTF